MLLLTDWLEENDIQYWTEGKNVSRGWVNIQCPFCSDHSNHCGISLKTLRISCWICGHHYFAELAKELTGCSHKKATEIKRNFLSQRAGDDSPLTKRFNRGTSSNTTVLPVESTTDFPPKFLKYLKRRGFTPPQKYIKKYRLLATHPIGQYKFRIIIPIYMKHRLVSFTSRDITGKQDPPYLSASDNEGAMNIKNTIYNYDNLKRGANAIVVEGVLDTWKLGDGAISTFGTKFTDRQIVLLKKKEIKTLFIMFDNDKAGEVGGKSLAKIMAPLVKKIEIITFETINDPGELSADEASILKYQINFEEI